MKYGLLYNTELNVFVLENPLNLSRTPLTDQQLRDRISGNGVLLQWMEFARSNPGKVCMCDMLPA